MLLLSKAQNPLNHWPINLAFNNWLKTLYLWGQRLKQRQQLAQMDSRMLKDIGISQGEALQEIQKPFWKS